ncbi:MAG: AAA domain-containing protein [Gammaproteobacteria bacterium]
MSQLRLAVEKISAMAGDFDRSESEAKLKDFDERIDELRRHRAETYGRLLESREAEVIKHEHDGEEITLAAIALNHARSNDRFGWISRHSVGIGDPCPLSDAEALEWLSLLRRSDIDTADLPTRDRLEPLNGLPMPADFLDHVQRESAAIEAIGTHSSVISHDAFTFVSQLSDVVRAELRDRVESLAHEAAELEARRESWMNDALTDIRTGRGSTWATRREEVLRLANVAAPLVGKVGAEFSITAPEDELAVLYQQARLLLDLLESGGKLRVAPDGSVKTGALAPKPVKAAQRFLEAVRINGLVPSTSEKIHLFVSWMDARRAIEAMDRAWPATVTIPQEDTLREGLQWHRTEVEQLERVLALGTRIDAETAWFRLQKLPIPDWNDLPSIRLYADVVAAVLVAEDADAAKTPLAALEGLLTSESRWQDAPACVGAFHAAVLRRDVAAYADAYRELSSIRERTGATLRMESLSSNLARSADLLKDAVAEAPFDDEWNQRLGDLNHAWEWEQTGEWILNQDSTDINVLQRQLDSIEDRLRKTVELLAAERAWGHAVSPTRLTAQARADLTQYAQLVSRLGKGTGRYAPKMRAEIKDAMRRCRPAVPVWIMPTYRIAEQLRIEPDLFDVVIVDEASQAGLESTFLQYLAPRMVVIGDDKQVSPSAVGVDQQKLRDLANQYLAGDRYIASWQDPKRSLFDEAKMRYGGLLTLTEHRRCVPEIIGYSNRIAYEPEGIRLIPVRQYGADRLEPIRAVHVADGYESGNTNPAEAGAIVDQIEKCLADPAYGGVTIGVISMLGKPQAKLIEHQLLDRVGTEEWAQRRIRCGDATDFQGSERDVMFLSMVKAADPDQRLYALTKSDAVQRFNVAASRARDQMWVFHSMPRVALTNKEDLRYQLLEYCYGVQARTNSDVEGSLSAVVPEDVMIEPFDSLFEQRVANRILGRGYTVIPQYDTHGYRIDMVIVGPSRRLAVECDGDHWHGPDAYQRDLSRQRDLERCGWQFFRIRESVFYADPENALAGLWEVLDELDIHPADWASPSDAQDSTAPDEQTETAEIEPVQDSSVTPPFPWSEVYGVGRHRSTSPPDSSSDLEADTGTVAEPDDHNAVLETVYRFDGELAGAGVHGLPAYEAFSDSTPPVSELMVDDLARELVRVVEVEGPVLGHRLHTAYVSASGGLRVGKDIARRLNRAIALAEGQGLIVSDNPLGETGVKPKIFRIPGQASVVMRSPGPRAIEQIPVNELAAHLRAIGAQDVPVGDEQLFRKALDRLGLRRLTEHTRATLVRAFEQVQDSS